MRRRARGDISSIVSGRLTRARRASGADLGVRNCSDGGNAGRSEVGGDAGDRVWTADTSDGLARRETLGASAAALLDSKNGSSKCQCQPAPRPTPADVVVVVSHIGPPCEAPRTRNQNRSHVSLGSDETHVAAATADRRLHLGTNVGTEARSEGTCLLRRRVVRAGRR